MIINHFFLTVAQLEKPSASVSREVPISQSSSLPHTPPTKGIPTSAAKVEFPVQQVASPTQVGEDRTVPLKGITKSMFKIMSEALKIPPFGYYDEVDVSRLVEMRKRLKSIAQQRGIQLTYMPIFIKVFICLLHLCNKMST